MSNLQRAFAKAKLAEFPPPFDEAEEDEDTDTFNSEVAIDDDSSSASSASSTGTIIPSSNQKLFARPIGFDSQMLAPSESC